MSDASPLRRLVREVGFGAVIALGALYMTFYGTLGSIRVIALVASAGVAIWIAGVDPGYLVTPRGSPRPMLFGLVSIAAALMITGAITFGWVSTYVAALILVVGGLSGFWRAVRVESGRQQEDRHGIP